MLLKEIPSSSQGNTEGTITGRVISEESDGDVGDIRDDHDMDRTLKS